MKPIIYLFILFLFIAGCKDKKQKEIIRIVSEWQGKEILFPENLIFTQYVKDTVDYRIPESEYKILVFVDSLGCTSCKLQLEKWKTFISEINTIMNGEVPFLFFFQSNNYEELYYLFKRERFDHPVCIDSMNEMDRLNNFSYNPTFQTFLLNRANEVILVGNPIYSARMKDLYLKYLSGDQEVSTPSERNTLKTSVQVINPEMDLGEFPVQTTRTVTFELKNTGQEPLVVIDISTTCGCAKATFNKQPVTPGNTQTIEVTMTPKEVGLFNETLTVICNTDKIIRLKIKGIAH
ncbi:MAG: DUF1573 domain-containing protein [Tannerellaceae bacterium]|nr:DUF1573 domain-containing protein [Tannerellaceae bacterium]